MNLAVVCISIRHGTNARSSNFQAFIVKILDLQKGLLIRKTNKRILFKVCKAQQLALCVFEGGKTLAQLMYDTAAVLTLSPRTFSASM